MNRRLAAQASEWIDRNQPISFCFEEQQYEGFRGDTLSSALWANGVRLMGRSFKYHRPRSSCTLAGYDANVVVENELATNIRGDLLPIQPGLNVHAVNTSGGLTHDRYNFIERFSRFLPVGFYYKAFHTPRRLFRFYENQMRKAAGLGRVNLAARSPVLPKDYAFCDLLVVGAGPTGLSAAIAAADAGLEVMIVDEQPKLGGSLCWQRADAVDTLDRLTRQLQSMPNATVRVGTQAAGWYADQWIALVDDRRLTKLRAQATLFATGCIEQPAVFHNNDRPGVLLGSAAQRLIRLYSVKPFDRAVVLTANQDGYRVALDLVAAGVDVAAIVDLRSEGSALELADAIARRGVEVLTGHAVYEAVTDRLGMTIQAAVVCRLDNDGTPLLDTARRIACNGIVMSVGWAPNSDLAAQSGIRFRYDACVEQLVPGELPPGVFAAGRINGVFSIEDRLADGRRAGLAAAAYLGRSQTVPTDVPRTDFPQSHPYPIFDHPEKKNFVDLDEDLQLVDLVDAHAEGYDSVELLKRYSTVGMGPSQGKLANMNAVRILARLNGQSLERTGTTTARPFHHPVSIAHLAGRRFHPYRVTPMDAWHRQAGAQMTHVGPWLRPEYYSISGRSRNDCILAEAEGVRARVGLIDLSTLGKLLVNGPDAARFLEHVFAGSFARQKIGRTRYALATDETGIISEEGIVARLADDRFYITASTAGADAFYREMQRWALVFRMDVVLANATGQWAAMNVAGPDARRVLERIVDDDIGPEAFAFGSVREMLVAGVRSVVMRSGFLGELSYEVHVPAPRAASVWKAVLDAGRDFKIRPFGIEAQRLLRLEKGHPIIGLDTDALTTPFEAQLDWAVDMTKPFFVGKRALEILRRKPVERKLVGITFSERSTEPLPEECQLVIDGGEIAGRVTSIAKRTTIGRPVGLAFVRPDLATVGTKISIRLNLRQHVHAVVTELPFYDRANNRQAL